MVRGVLAYDTTLTTGSGHGVLFDQGSVVTFYGNGAVQSGVLSDQAEGVSNPVGEHNTSLIIPSGHAVLFRGGTRVAFYPDGRVQSGTLAENRQLPDATGAVRTFARDTVVTFGETGRVVASEPPQGGITGSWAISTGGGVGSSQENHAFYQGTLSFSTVDGRLHGRLEIGGGPETLQNVAFESGAVSFDRPLSNGIVQHYTGTLQEGRLRGTFTHGTARQAWWAEKAPRE